MVREPKMEVGSDMRQSVLFRAHLELAQSFARALGTRTGVARDVLDRLGELGLSVTARLLRSASCPELLRALFPPSPGDLSGLTDRERTAWHSAIEQSASVVESDEKSPTLIAAPIGFETQTLGALIIGGTDLKNHDIPAVELMADTLGMAIAIAQYLVDEEQRWDRERSEGQEVLQRTIDGVEEPILIINTNHTVRHMNRVVRERYREAVPSSGHVCCYQLSHRRDAPCSDFGLQCPLRMVRETLAPVSVTHEHTDPKGKKQFVEILASPLFDASGELSGIIETSRDITELRKAEEEVIRARKLESVGLLAGGIAHDFNNLLTVIQGNMSLARRHVAPDTPQARSLEDAESACRRARDLTQQLLTFSKGGAPVREPASVAELIAESVRFSLRGSSIRCDLDFEDDLWSADVDAGQITQVISNIVINAVQAMSDGGRIWVSAHNVHHAVSAGALPPGRYVAIDIADEGTGIPQEHLGRVFDPYFTTKEQGTGLGLATAYSIVKNHEGTLSVESTEGKGSVFHLYLPASAVPQVPTPRPQSRTEAGVGRVLVMDDDDMVRTLTGSILSHLGYEAEAVADGAEALTRYAAALENGRPFDAVILDLTVPGGMGGRETMARLLRMHPQVKAIVSSGYSQDPVMAHSADYGFQGVVAKPYGVDELAEALRGVLAIRGGSTD